MKINVNKSKICVYGTRSMLDKGVDIDILIDGLKLSRCEVYTYLGVQIDECLTLQKHFNYICRKFAQKFVKLSKLKNSVDDNTRILLYKQTILPLVEYADIMLYHVRKHDLEKLQRLQNKALRLCLDIINPQDISTEDLHKSVNLMTLDNRRELHLMNLMHKYREPRPWLHENALNTRNADKKAFATEVPNLSVYSNSPFYTGSKLWNDLPKFIQSLETKANFQKAYMDYMNNR